MKTNRRSLILRLLAVFGGAATVLKTGILQASPADRPARATSRLSPSTVRWADGSERTIHYDERGRVIEVIETSPDGRSVHTTYEWVPEAS